MQKLLELAGRFGEDEDGAALVEYTVLLGILVAAVIVTIGLVGTWISGRWDALADALPGAVPPAP
jgi:pilus assembly protein Flp/PilA